MSRRVQILVMACSVCVALRHFSSASSALAACLSGPYPQQEKPVRNAGLAAADQIQSLPLGPHHLLALAGWCALAD